MAEFNLHKYIDELKKLNLSPEQIFGVLHFVEKYYTLK